jgi:hypothetical protein
MSGPSGTTTDTTATIVFDVNNLQPTQELSAPTVTCTLDSGTPLLCDSPARYSGLTVGDHQVVIKATGSTGSVGSARVAWKIVANGQALRGAVPKAVPPWVLNFPKVLPPRIPRAVLPKSPGFRTHVADNVVTRSDSFVPAEDVLPTTGSRTTENILVGFAALGIGVALLGAASFSRRKSV